MAQKTLCCTDRELSARAAELADTGAYNHWEEIGAALEGQDCPGAVARLEANSNLRRLVNARCNLAKLSKPKP